MPRAEFYAIQSGYRRAFRQVKRKGVLPARQLGSDGLRPWLVYRSGTVRRAVGDGTDMLELVAYDSDGRPRVVASTRRLDAWATAIHERVAREAQEADTGQG